MVINIVPGNVRNKIINIKDKSVELIITSPPYGKIIDYNHPDQIGYGQTFSEYYADLDIIWKNCVRILHPACRMVINIGDEFVKGGKDPFHIIPHRSKILESVLSNSNMMYTGTIIWKKVNGSASGTNGGILGSVDTPRNGHFFVNREYLLTFKKKGRGPSVTQEQKEKSKFTSNERRSWFCDTWNIPGENQDVHPAQFPIDIPERLIKMYSFVDETIFDPFCGTGTSLIAAELNQRNSIGIELGWGNEWIDVVKAKMNDFNINPDNVHIH